MSTKNESDSTLDIREADSPAPLESATSSVRPLGSEPAIQLSRSHFVLVFIGLALAVLLAAIDQVIVATAIAVIGNEFQNFQMIPWIGTSYLLTSAAVTPVYGKLSDIFGRKPTIIVAIVIFLIGSGISGGAMDMNVLIAGRAIAGIGGGGLMSLVMIVIADMTPLATRGRYQGIIGSVFGFASVIGPFVGGAFTDGLTWRWCFWINFPVGVVALVIIVVFLKAPSGSGTLVERIRRIDTVGFLLMSATTISLLLPIQNGGIKWDWNAPQTIALFVTSGVCLVLFVVYERSYAREPMIPTAVFANRSTILLVICSFLIGSSIFTVISYVPLYFQVVNGATAMQAGISMFPLVIPLTFVIVASGILISYIRRYRFILWIGFALSAIGAGLVSLLDENSNAAQRIGFLLVLGFGGGMLMQTKTIAMQNSVMPQHIGIGTSLVTFGQVMGSALGIAIGGSVLNNKVVSSLASAHIPSDVLDLITQTPIALRMVLQSNPSLLMEAMHAYVQGLQSAFILSIPCAILGLLLSLAVVEWPQQKLADAQSKQGEKV
ncbi:major facilitator superfamily domain-containing protein [Polychytrium aggregatum]|uniref:major facilitator superfamily domain-containing protein n=1 Tax=Polychytrium aggregatum TaxID=110093 RepID=UPI0022FE7272|nr:major facilitator superfamily domain-containing protein [Polychytrium aggregatum]KAI9205723.1 major facilitator superfamily domain-containing protein [Polychytrium aggregatum]